MGGEMAASSSSLCSECPHSASVSSSPDAPCPQHTVACFSSSQRVPASRGCGAMIRRRSGEFREGQIECSVCGSQAEAFESEQQGFDNPNVDQCGEVIEDAARSSNVDSLLVKSACEGQSENYVSNSWETVVSASAITRDGVSVVSQRDCTSPMLKMDEDAIDFGKSALKHNEIEYAAMTSLESTLEQEKHKFDLRSCFQGVKSNKLLQKIQQQYQTLQERSQTIDEMREKLSNYRPGDWLVETGGMSRKDYAIPKVTTLLLVGPSGAGKSTLINNMIRVLNKRTSGFDRAQVCDELENGSYFLQEYMIVENVKSVCVFDSRGLSKSDTATDLAMLKTWMQEGICHGQAALRQSDSCVVTEALEGRGRHGHSKWSMKREINFVIFVVDAVSVLRMKEISDLVRLFKSPYISFKDDRPAVVMTHGDQLSPIERLYARVLIGQNFGISPVDQVFDISGGLM
eukprot:c28600_g1_i2 orf=148-1524(+)